MTRCFVAVFVFLMMACMHENNAYALDTTLTGFYYPIGEDETKFSQANGGWLYGTPGQPQYMDGNQHAYHIGVDMMTETNDPSEPNSEVYAIADGTVIGKNQSDLSWGSTTINNIAVANYGVFVRHKTADGSEFVALYGHIQPDCYVVKDGTVKAGHKIGYTGDYPGGAHLHFGIHLGSVEPYADSSLGIGWGRMNENYGSDQNGFVDPIDYIKIHTPNNWITAASYEYFRVSDLAWSPSNVSCINAGKWIRYNVYPGYPELGVSITDSNICNEFKLTVMWDPDLGSNWFEILYGSGDINQYKVCQQ